MSDEKDKVGGDVGTRICSTCKEEKRLDEFHKRYDKRRSNPNGHQYACKACQQAYNREYEKNNKEKRQESHRKSNEKHRVAANQRRRERYRKKHPPKPPPDYDISLFKRCTKCGEVKPLSSFDMTVSHGKHVRQTYCVPCRRVAGADRRKEIAAALESGETIVPTEQKCNACSCVKPICEFGRNMGRRCGYKAICKVCTAARSREGTYGLRPHEYEQLLQKQNNTCPICKIPFSSTPTVDHDHKTGKVRALLCMTCNVALGSLRDSRERVRAAAAYLESHAPDEPLPAPQPDDAVAAAPA